MIDDELKCSGYLLDPHTAVAMVAARKLPQTDAPMVVLSTAHPAKFPAAVEAASGVHPALPPWLGDLFERTETYERLPADLAAIEQYVLKYSRAAGAKRA